MSLTATGTQVAWHDPGAAEENKCCCGDTCCMYPASGLGTTYTADDLPETILWNRFHLGVTATMTMSSNGDGTYSGSGWSYSGGTWEGAALPPSADFQVASGVWAIFYDGDQIGTLGDCLITEDGNLTPGDDAVEDQFAASYQVIIDGGDPITVYRRSLCVWSNKPFDPPCDITDVVTLWYDDYNPIVWCVEVFEFWTEGGLCIRNPFGVFAAKNTPNLSSPVGDYYAHGGDPTPLTVVTE